MNRIYLDNAATTPLLGEVLEAMLPVLRNGYGNPSSLHATGREARRLLEQAREQVADALGAQRGEIFFTSGGTEADNWAIKSAAQMRSGQIVSSAIEHHAVLHAVSSLEKAGRRAVYLPVSPEGIVQMDALDEALAEETALVSIMAANNEMGAIQPISAIAAKLSPRGILLHTDAVQAFGNMALDVKEWGVDLLSISGHKIGAPKGVGALFIKRGLALPPFIDGGGQEKGLRSGTENLASIVGFGCAAGMAKAQLQQNIQHETALRDHMIARLTHELPGVYLNGGTEHRLPGNVSLRFAGIRADALLLRLDMAGIAASAGSACSAGATQASHVIAALGHDPAEARGTIRFGIWRQNTLEEIDETIEQIKQIVGDMRK